MTKINKPRFNIGLTGRFKFITRNNDLEVIRETDWMDNLVTDIGLNRIGTGGVQGYCRVGSGSATPTTSDTSLQTQVAATGSTVGTGSQPLLAEWGGTSSAPYYGWTRVTYRFAEGAAAGNLSEVGIGWASSGTTLFSRALIKDSMGDPTTITILSNEVLDVVYELRLYPPTADVTFDLEIDEMGTPVTYACVLRAALVSGGYWWSGIYLLNRGSIPDPGTGANYVATSFTGGIGTIVQDPSGTEIPNSDVVGVLDSYSNNSLKRVITYTMGFSNSNHAGGIASILLSNAFPALGRFQCSFTPNLPKNIDRTLALTTELSWTRHTI